MNTSSIELAIIEEHTIIRKAFVNLLHSIPGCVVSIEASNGQAMLNKINLAQNKPDICLIGTHTGSASSFQLLRILGQAYPHLPVLVVTEYADESFILSLLRNGAAGCICSCSEPDELHKALVAIHKIGYYYPNNLNPRLFATLKNAKQPTAAELTEKEVQVLQYCCIDLSYAEMGERMHYSRRTVEGYRDSLFAKLNVNSKVGLVLYALRSGLVNLGQVGDGRSMRA